MNINFNHLPDGIKHALNAVSFKALLGSLVSVLPNIAAFLTIIWTVIRMYETALSLPSIQQTQGA